MGEPSAWRWLLAAAASAGAELVAPPRCASCDVRVPRRSAFCAECASTVQTASDSAGEGGDDRRCFAAFEYGGAIAEAITRMKYRGRPDLARPLGDLLAGSLAPHAASLRDCVVIPVPLHPSRLAERGFNQSALLARRVARALRIPCLPMALARTHHAAPQATLDRGARASNLIGTFRPRERERLRSRAVLLVDDVRTTGATLRACSLALDDACVATVKQAVVARVPAGL
jgi:ComF family protein